MEKKEMGDFAVNYAKKSGATYAEARVQTTKSNSFLLNSGNLEGVSFNEEQGIGIRLIYNNSFGFISTNRLDKESIKKLIQKKIKHIKNNKNLAEKAELSNEKAIKANQILNEKIKIEDTTTEEKLSILRDIEKDIKKTKIKTPLRVLSLSDKIINKYYINSEGTIINSRFPRVRFFWNLIVLGNNDSAQKYQMYDSPKGYEIFKEEDIKNDSIKTVKYLDTLLKKGKRIIPKKMDVVLGSEVVGIICHESIGHPTEADRILGRESAQAGESYLKKDMLGYRIGSKYVNIVDDPTIPKTPGFYKYDDEGVKAKRKHLVKNGIINEFIHDRTSAAKFNVKSNAGARAQSYNKEPIPRMSNTIMLPGDFTEEEIIEDIKEGIFIKSYMEWNINDTRLNQRYQGSECYAIKNGEISYLVKNPILEITTPKLFNAIDGITKKINYLAGPCGKGEPNQTAVVSMGGPAIRIRKVMIK